MSNYASMAKRIRDCSSKEDFVKAERSMMRVYDAGALTESEFARLDCLMVDRMIALDIVSTTP